MAARVASDGGDDKSDEWTENLLPEIFPSHVPALMRLDGYETNTSPMDEFVIQDYMELAE